MSMMWNQRTSDPSDVQEQGDGDLKIIPLWSIILAIVVFVGWEYFMNHGTPPPRHHPTPLQQVTHLAFVFMSGTALASAVLLTMLMRSRAARELM